MRTLRTVVGALLLASMGTICSFAQTVTFRAEELLVSPSDITTTKCVQVGLFMTYEGGMDSNWAQVTSTLDYTAPVGFLSGDPFVTVSKYAAAPGAPGLTDPGTVITNGKAEVTPCVPADIINSVNQNLGANINFHFGNGTSLTSELVNTGTGRVTLSALNFGGTMYTLQPGVEVLYAVIEFPLAANQGTGQIDINFTPNGVVADGNIISDGVTTLNAITDDGFIQVFDTVDCGDATSFVDVTDNVGSGSVSTQNTPNQTIGIDYLDPGFGGVGGDLTFDTTFGAGVVSYQITGDDGYDSGVVPVVSPGTDSITINTQGDGSPSTSNPTTIYSITYFVLGLDGMTPVPGTPCQVTVNWNPASCVLTWVNNGIGGANSTLTLALTNGVATAMNYASIDVPNGATGLADPILVTNATTVAGTAGGTVTLTVIDQSIPDASWAGTYTASGLASGNGPKATNCSDTIGFVCPTDVSTLSSVDAPVSIGGDITVNLGSNGDTQDYDVTYNGVTTNVPAATPSVTLMGVVVANITSVTVTANGVGPDGMPCSDSADFDLVFAAASCDSITQSPDSTVTPVDVGTVITITVTTTNATNVFVDGAPATPMSDPNTTLNNTWTANHVAVTDTTLTISVETPGATPSTTDCGTTDIFINCMVISIGVTPDGIIVTGTPDCDFDIYCAGPNAGLPVVGNNIGPDAVFLGTVLTNGSGVANLNIIPSPDSVYAATVAGSPVVGAVSPRTVPTLGEWGLIGFITLLLGAAIFFMRRQRLA
jgi:hypothetical protein